MAQVQQVAAILADRSNRNKRDLNDRGQHTDLCRGSQQKTVETLCHRWKNREVFMASMNPGVQTYAGRFPERAFFGEAPTLTDINLAYGQQTSVLWLVPQLIDLSEYCGCREKLTEHMLEELARIISIEYHYYKTSELLLFFYWFKVGKYGHFYGSVDPMVITTALQDFVLDRRTAYTKQVMEEERRKREAWANDDNITYEEYLKLKKEGKK